MYSRDSSEKSSETVRQEQSSSIQQASTRRHVFHHVKGRAHWPQLGRAGKTRINPSTKASTTNITTAKAQAKKQQLQY
jgi:hypothetical protein